MLEFFRQHIGGFFGIVIVGVLAHAFALSFGAQSAGWGQGQSERYAALTLPDYFEARFGDDGLHVLRLISVCIILLSYCGYLAAQFIAAGKLFETVSESIPGFEVSYGGGILVGAGIVLLYTIVGGFIAVSWTDVLQGMLMLVAVTLVPIMALVLNCPKS